MKQRRAEQSCFPFLPQSFCGYAVPHLQCSPLPTCHPPYIQVPIIHKTSVLAVFLIFGRRVTPHSQFSSPSLAAPPGVSGIHPFSAQPLGAGVLGSGMDPPTENLRLSQAFNHPQATVTGQLCISSPDLPCLRSWTPRRHLKCLTIKTKCFTQCPPPAPPRSSFSVNGLNHLPRCSA